MGIGEDTADFAALAEQICAGGLSLSDTSLTVCPLPFYKDCLLVRCDRDVLSLRFLLLGTAPLTERAVYVLDGRSPVIHHVNEVEGLHLDDDNVLDYLRFFCANLKMDNGQPFEVCEGRTFMLEDGTPLKTRHLELTGRCPDAGYFASGVMLHQGNVFEARFHISLKGFVNMIDDDGGTPVFTIN